MTACACGTDAMKENTYRVWQESEYTYPAAFGFIPFLRSYLHEDDEIRPCVIVCPGGGYRLVSPTEGELVAKAFYAQGFQAFVFTYTCNLLSLAPLKDQPLADISRAVRFVRKRAEEFRVCADRLAVCGFSAAGHLCASLAVYFEDAKEPDPSYAAVSNRPDAVILSYPVITSGQYAHRDSFTALLGEDATEEELQYMSLETQVKENTPPCFLWQTATDELVPVENSFLMAKALKAEGIPFAYHVFTDGVHGLSVATEDWAQGRFGEPYTMEQIFAIVKAAKEGRIPLPEQTKEQLLSAFDPEGQGMPDVPEEMKPKANAEVAVWPQLAGSWLKKILPAG